MMPRRVVVVRQVGSGGGVVGRARYGYRLQAVALERRR